MLKLYLIIIFFVLTFNSNAEIKEKIIQNLKNTKNLDFKFEQNVNGKIENGNCTIEYPKKIFCEYARSNNKILVSNGKSLVIKTITSYYRYPLAKTPLNVILDKKVRKIEVSVTMDYPEKRIKYTKIKPFIDYPSLFFPYLYALVSPRKFKDLDY